MTRSRLAGASLAPVRPRLMRLFGFGDGDRRPLARFLFAGQWKVDSGERIVGRSEGPNVQSGERRGVLLAANASVSPMLPLSWRTSIYLPRSEQTGSPSGPDCWRAVSRAAFIAQ